MGSRGGVVVRALASHQCGPGSIPGHRRHMWVEFVVGSHPCSERFFSGFSGFSSSSKFQFDLESVANKYSRAKIFDTKIKCLHTGDYCCTSLFAMTRKKGNVYKQPRC